MYTCPMHAAIRQEHAGMCSECGMVLVQIKEQQGKHAKHHAPELLKKFWVSFVVTIPVLLYSDIFVALTGWQAPMFVGSQFLSLVLGSFVFLYGGLIFLQSAQRELQAKLPGMMTLIALAITTAYSYSVFVVITGRGEALFWELTSLITVMLLGHWIEMKAVSGTQSALKELSKLLPDQVEVIKEGKTMTISLEEIRVGDLVLVKPGGKIPTDGIVQEGISDVNESLATGESKPVVKKQGDEVIAGTSNGDGALTIQVTKIGDSTFLAGVMRLVAQAQASKSKLQMVSDRAAYYLTIIAIVVGTMTFVIWLVLAETSFAIERMVAVFVIACPHALGLAIPLVASISTTKAAQSGFLVKQRLALEVARNIDIVLFDKTGTLTQGAFGIESVLSAEPNNEKEVLQLAASVNKYSEHPIAKATVQEAEKRNIALLEVLNFQRIPGKGVQAVVEGTEVFIGSEALVKEKKAVFTDVIKTEVAKLAQQGKAINFVIVRNQAIGALVLADSVRKESYEAITTLHTMGIATAMITGDTEDVAQQVAKELGIDQYFARVLPSQKSEKVKLLQEQGKKVAMVGDGVNDAPALTQADLGIAIGAGTNVAIESAGIILVRDDPRDIAKVIKLSRLTYTKMIQNLFWATGYNIVAIPLAAGVLAFQGVFLQPALAALFMSLSTVIVAINAVLLRRQKL
jgi:P-type Cu2+ transporter